jgi:hypothetical protein
LYPSRGYHEEAGLGSIVGMTGVPAYVAAFEGLRPAVLNRLLEVRPSLDHALSRLTVDEARSLFDGVLIGLRTLLLTGDHALHRGFVQTFLALRGADGLAPDHALRVLVAIGDVAIQVARRDRPDEPTLVLAITSAIRVTARIVNEMIADDIARRSAQRRPTEVWR